MSQRDYFINKISTLYKIALECERLDVPEKALYAHKNRFYEACVIARELNVLNDVDIKAIKDRVAL